MSGAETHYRSLGIDECQLVEEHSYRDEAVPEGAVDCRERMPE